MNPFACCPAASRISVCLLGIGLLGGAAGWGRAAWQDKRGLVSPAEAATRFRDTLDEKARQTALKSWSDASRFEWHFIPKDHRKGLQFKDMTPPQKKAALALLRSCLSPSGANKARRIMQLEGVLRELEKDRRGGAIRDTQRYYFTLFGGDFEAKWGLSIEGHHLSLNFVFEGDKCVAGTPAFFASNPALVREAVGDTPKGARVLASEELLAFSLVHLLNPAQRKVAIFAEKAPAEIRAAGEKQPPQDPAIGLAFQQMNAPQRQALRALVQTYAANMPREVSQRRMQAIQKAGWDNVRFAWAGPDYEGVGHYYRIQGPTFLIEFVNTQPDAAGNPANHVHCVWRDMRGDFGEPIASP